MQPISFHCPHCRALLRSRDKTLAGKVITCPDCGRRFSLTRDGRTVLVSESEQNEPAAASSARTRRRMPNPALETKANSQDGVWWQEPHIVAWAVFIVFGVGMIIALWPESDPEPSDQTVAAAPDSEKSPQGETQDTNNEESEVTQKEGEPAIPDQPPPVLFAEAPSSDDAESEAESPATALGAVPPPPEPDSKPEDNLDELIEIVDEFVEAESEQKDPEEEKEEKPPAVLTEGEIRDKLNQPIVRYRSTPGSKFGEQLKELEELVAAPLQYDPKPWQQPGGIWEQRVPLDLKDVTVGEVLNKLLENVGLEATIGEGAIGLRKAKKNEESTEN